MTNDVGQLVLQDNYYQTQTLSVGVHTARKLLEQQQRMIRFSKRRGGSIAHSNTFPTMRRSPSAAPPAWR